MSKKLLIDARQDDETRVVLLNNNKIEDYNHETSHRKQLKGNIYLARVTRVEPSLQAAFVEYGGNRQGFLAFSEIHPDYYRIPIEDREKLLAEEEERAARENEDSEDNGENSKKAADTDEKAADTDEKAADTDELVVDSGEDNEDELRSERRRKAQSSRHYKIQEVISNRQILLIQVVKEERGGKGAALTTYLSLAGRYCVLMPNTHHGGGVSRKISNSDDRKKLKKIINGLEIPKGMGVILRTAGSKRTKAEINRDFTYLSRQWDEIRALTMESNAPVLIHEEGNLVKRAIRDYYTSDVDEVLVEGDEAYKSARTHMKNLMPSHVKKVRGYDDTSMPLFQKHQVEAMLSAMHDPQVTLKSGGYLVINQAEALVAIDVNSGRATRERNIEETALKTNLEAAAEIAQQLRQRDLAGLIVIDFIDMENNRNKRAVERKLKESVSNDRARIQLGSISQFGLLEMSRQRLRPSLAETVSDLCPHCQGTGRIRSVESAALQALRSIEAEAIKGRGDDLFVYMSASIAIYILNNKRDVIAGMEQRFGIAIRLHQDDSLIAPETRFGEDPSLAAAASEKPEGRSRRRRGNRKGSDNTAEKEAEASTKQDNSAAKSDDENGEDKSKRHRRRGKRGGRKRRRDQGENGAEAAANTNNADVPAEAEEKRKPRSRNKAAPDTGKTEAANEAPSDTAADETKPKAPRKKSARKKSAKAKSAGGEDTAKPDAKAKTEKKQAAKTKKPAAGKKASKGKKNSTSSPVNVVDIDAVKPASKKKGWWNS
ncbi:MAG: Rne/Rng family ribonuclease [Parvularculales bacterium]